MRRDSFLCLIFISVSYAHQPRHNCVSIKTDGE